MRDSEQGFSLIELLVVMGIIGILAAITIPQFESYKTRGFNARALSDLRNTISAQEAQYVDNESYVDNIEDLEGFDNESPAVTLVMNANAVSWSGYSYHPSGTLTFCFDSGTSNGIVEVNGVASACP